MKKAFKFSTLSIFFFAVLSNTSLFCQVWYFGQNAGINFSATPISISGNGPISTTEGCSLTYDANGNVLFCTDGSTVQYNNGNGFSLLQNGTGLMGNPSATQSALIVPIPQSNCQKYFICTVDAAENNLANGFRYSVADFSNPSSPSIASNLKNLTTTQTTSAEKLTGIKDPSGNGFWVLTHGFDPSTSNNVQSNSNGYKFYAYHITSSSTNLPTPIITSIGTLHYKSSTVDNRWAWGQMKFSHDGKKVAVALSGQKIVEIFDFNNGTLSNSKKIEIPSAYAVPYGVEFSPNSQYLFVSCFRAPGISGNNSLFQFDVNNLPTASSNWSSLDIRSNVSLADHYQINALQLAPDGKIYVARQLDNGKFVGIIQNPNAFPATFVEQGIDVSQGNTSQNRSRAGLPTILQGNYNCYKDVPPIAFDPCCPPMNAELMRTMFTREFDNPTLTSPYKLKFTPTAQFLSTSQAYCDYIKTLYPNIGRLTFSWELRKAEGCTPPAKCKIKYNEPVGQNSTVYNWFTPGGNGVLNSTTNFFNETLNVNECYGIHVGIFTEPASDAFKTECSNNTFFCYRIEVNQGMRKAIISDGTKIIAEYPIDQGGKKN